jgi:predicted PurR-regulated permease PerM
MEKKSPLNLIIIVFFLIVGLIAYGLGDTLTPLLISFILAYLVFPLVKKLEAKGIQRNMAVFSVFGLFILMALTFLVLIIPFIYTEGKEFVQEFPVHLENSINKN